METSAMCYGAANATCNFSPPQQGQCESWKTSSSSSSSSSCNFTSAATNKQQQQNESYLCRSPVDLNMNSFSLSPIDFEPLPNLFTFAQCGSSYKDFSLYKEKNPHDMADVLLSLKHAVVRPGQMHQLGSLPPLSPVAGVSATTFSPITYAHGQQLSPNLYGSVTSPSSVHHGYAPPTSQYYIESPCSTQGVSAGNLTVQANQPSNNNPQTFQSGQPNLFPSMSLNVSMNMTMGMGAYNMMDHHHHHHHQHQMNVNPTGPQLHHHQTHHQIPSWTSATMSTQPSLHQNPASNYPTLQMPYATHTYPATGSYTFAAELRSPNNPSNTLDIDGDFLFSSHTSTSHPAFRTTLKTSPKTVTTGNLSEPAVTCKKRPRVHQELTPLTKANLCRICGKTYARPSTLKVHIRTHTGQKPYRCADCAKSFSQAANLSAHARTHSGEKPFGCPICGRRFSQSSSVTTHIRTHSGERPYGCPVLNCKKAFSDSSTLTKHLRIHTGQKPYECRICSLRFSQSGNLNRHMRIHAAAA